MNIINSNFDILKEISHTNEGLVLLGTGGDLSEWITGVTKMMIEADVVSPDFEVTEAHKVKTWGGRTDLLLLFDGARVNIGKLAMWRTKFGDCSWLTDYIDNYEDQHDPSKSPQLIAAAPDLLAACEAFVEAWEKCLQLEKTDVALTMAKAAIEKARES